MNKQEYLSAIRVRIPKMPTEDMERFIAYYSEMIDDRMEDGMTEEEAVARFWKIRHLAKSLSRRSNRRIACVHGRLF